MTNNNNKNKDNLAVAIFSIVLALLAAADCGGRESEKPVGEGNGKSAETSGGGGGDEKPVADGPVRPGKDCAVAGWIFERVYDDAHFKKENKQTVRSINAKFGDDCQSIGITIRLRGKDADYHYFGQWGADSYAADMDGGQVKARTATHDGRPVAYLTWNHLRIVNQKSCTSSEDGPDVCEDSSVLEGNSQDNNFRLFRK